MSDFHAITAQSFDHREVHSLRRRIVDWHAYAWNGDYYDRRFAAMWKSGQFDNLEARCEEFVNSR